MVKLKNVTSESCNCVERGIFRELGIQSLDQVSKFKVMNRYKKGQTLFTEGSPGLGLYCLNSGKLKISKTMPDGKETIMRILGPGDVVGHQNILTNDKHTTTATMLEEGSVCFIDKVFITELMKQEISLSLNIIRMMNIEMNEAENRNAAMSHKTVRERLADLLISLKNKYGVQVDHRTRLDIKLTREEMASIVGTANETIIRFMSEFKQEGILEQEGKVIFLLDVAKLSKSANQSA